MTRDPDALRALATLLAYPGPELAARAAECAERLAPRHPAAAQRLARFAAFALGAGPAALEEAYTSAFVLPPLCSPYVGDQLFGASAERAYLLSGLRALGREAGVEPGGELADHVSEVLRLAAAELPEDVRADLLRDGLAPALRKMLAALEDGRHPWADVLAAALVAVDARGERQPAREATP